VVAYNQPNPNDPALRLSIPKAEKRIVVPDKNGIRRKDADPCEKILVLRPGQSMEYEASTTDSTTTGYTWLIANKPSYISVAGTNTGVLTITNAYTQSGAPQAGLPLFGIRCIAFGANGADTSEPLYPAYEPFAGVAMRTLVARHGTLHADSDIARGLDFVTQPGEDVISIRPLAVKPQGDSTGYGVVLRGFAAGTIGYNDVRLLMIDHPPGTEIGGSAECGFKVYHRIGSTLIEETTRGYPLRELRCVQAYHTQDGIVTDYLRDHDSLAVVLSESDSLVLHFTEVTNPADSTVIDSLHVPDTSMANWEREYILAIAGVYSPAGLAKTRPVSVASREGAFELGEGIPNPGSLHTRIPYVLAVDGPMTLTLFDSRGTLVETLADGFARRGRYLADVDLSGLSQGAYYYRLSAGAWSETRRLMVVR